MLGKPFLALAAIAALSPSGDGAAALPVSAPPAEYRPSAVARKAAALAAPAARPLRIVLPVATDAEARALQRKNALAAGSGGKAAAKRAPIAIGYARAVPAGSRVVALSSLEWTSAADGSRVARLEIVSPGAAGVRLALSMAEADPDLEIRFTGSAPGADVHGPFPANVVAGATARHGHFVTPVLEGDTGVVELHAADGAAVEKVSIVLGPVSHLLVAGQALRSVTAKDAADIGASGACNLDVACVNPSPALQQTSNSVGKLVANDRGGYTFVCSATMLNDTVTSFTPYVFTSAHCIVDAYQASTVNVYWFFRAQTCGSLQAPPYVLQGGGAMLLARSDDWDWTLLRLGSAPPAGTFFAAWRAEPVPQLAIGTTLHHPQGDVMKWSQGSSPGYQTFSDGSSFIQMQWSQGTTEVGSSGGGLFTFLPEGGYYELRGSLFGGEASCSNRSGIDYYSRLDNMLPLVRQYLTPDQPNAANQTVVVEYYHRGLDHYFVTADADEINLLDTGVLRGWERTGVRFLAYAGPAPGTNPVCRFYLRPEVGDSHFYSADPAECERVRQQYPAWVYESPAVFYIALPDPATGACAAGERPIWRFYNVPRINHRYTPEVTLRDRMRGDPGIWIPEGYGPDAVIMCSPTANE